MKFTNSGPYRRWATAFTVTAPVTEKLPTDTLFTHWPAVEPEPQCWAGSVQVATHDPPHPSDPDMHGTQDGVQHLP